MAILSLAILGLVAQMATAQPGGGGGGGGGGGPPPNGGGGGGGTPSPPDGAEACKVDGSSATMTWDTTSDPDFVIVTSNGCPNHYFVNAVGNNPNTAYEQTYNYRIPKRPMLRNASLAKNTNMNTFLGAFGVSLANSPLFSPAVNQQGGDAGQSEIDTFDCGQGHATPSGEYHYHIAPFLLDQAQPALPGTKHSPLYGYLVDGVPVYGPNGDNGLPATGLDDCNGHSGDGGGLGYHYHTNAPDGVVPGPAAEASTANRLPYFAGCLAGCVPDTGNGAGAQAETWATCVASSSPAAMGSVPTYAGERTTLSIATSAYNYSGCPASFLAEFEKENAGGDTNGASAGGAAAAALAVVFLVMVTAA